MLGPNLFSLTRSLSEMTVGMFAVVNAKGVCKRSVYPEASEEVIFSLL